METQMSAVAWKTGARNAGIALVGVSAFEVALFIVIWQVFRQSVWDAARVSFAVFWFVMYAAFLVVYLRDKYFAGTVLHDYGSRPMR